MSMHAREKERKKRENDKRKRGILVREYDVVCASMRQQYKRNTNSFSACVHEQYVYICMNE